MSSMFERYGGFTSVSNIVTKFYNKVLDSDTIGPYFDDVDMKSLIDHQIKFVAQVMGGPAEYNNDVLQRVHADMKIDREVYDEAKALLRESLEEFGVEPSDVEIVLDDIEGRSSFIISS
ncbi:MAG: group I truncated hemoglobin [Geminicoccaceae bacterium]